MSFRVKLDKHILCLLATAISRKEQNHKCFWRESHLDPLLLCGRDAKVCVSSVPGNPLGSSPSNGRLAVDRSEDSGTEKDSQRLLTIGINMNQPFIKYYQNTLISLISIKNIVHKAPFKTTIFFEGRSTATTEQLQALTPSTCLWCLKRCLLSSSLLVFDHHDVQHMQQL